MSFEIRKIEISEVSVKNFACSTQVKVSLKDGNSYFFQIISVSELHGRTDDENIDNIIDELVLIIQKMFEMNININSWKELIEFDQPNQISVNFFGRDELLDEVDEVLRGNYLESYPY